MKTKRDNKIILDLNKCQWARFYYTNDHGDKRNEPVPEEYFTVHGQIYHLTDKAYPHHLYPEETMFERAKRFGWLDIWTPEIYFKVTANAGVIFFGDKALAMRDAWNAKIFGKKK